VAGGRIVHVYRGKWLPFNIIGIGVVAMRMRGLSRGDVLHAAMMCQGFAGWSRYAEHPGS
jgi:hypothetical protein